MTPSRSPGTFLTGPVGLCLFSLSDQALCLLEVIHPIEVDVSHKRVTLHWFGSFAQCPAAKRLGDLRDRSYYRVPLFDKN